MRLTSYTGLGLGFGGRRLLASFTASTIAVALGSLRMSANSSGVGSRIVRSGPKSMIWAHRKQTVTSPDFGRLLAPAIFDARSVAYPHFKQSCVFTTCSFICIILSSELIFSALTNDRQTEAHQYLPQNKHSRWYPRLHQYFLWNIRHRSSISNSGAKASQSSFIAHPLPCGGGSRSFRASSSFKLSMYSCTATHRPYQKPIQ